MLLQCGCYLSQRGVPSDKLPLASSRSQWTRLNPTSCSAQAGLVGTNSPSIVKICGIVSAADAELAAKAGADLVGLIAWPKAKRSVSIQKAKEIATAARDHGAQPVAVFVDETPEQIAEFCYEIGITHAQLHGNDARKGALLIRSELQVVYVMQADDDGTIVTELPDRLDSSASAGPRTLDWILVDGMQGGSGMAFDWSNLQKPVGLSTKGWLLAGGLHPDNVADAVRIARPTGVDVSSGVAGPDGLKKDPEKVRSFVDNARRAFQMAHST